MEYFRDGSNKIQADIAYRLGHIALQYARLRLPDDRFFPQTLNLCILQNVLTNCVELVRAMSEHERRQSFFRSLVSGDPPWGLHSGMITRNSLDGKEVTVEHFLVHLRNALSHPTATDPDAAYPSTGYTTLPTYGGSVQTYYFVSSPDTRNNRPKTWRNRKEAEQLIGNRSGDFPTGVAVGESPQGGYMLVKDGKAFARIFTAKLTVEELGILVQGLCNHLAQPIQEAWDGETIAELVA